MKKVVIVGAGMTGLGAAHKLEKEKKKYSLSYKILEQYSRPGGLCRTEEVDGFLFDYTAHLLHFKTEYFKNLVNTKVDTGIITHKRSSWIYSNGVYTNYPFQANLYGLPEEIIVECLYEYSKVYFNKNQEKIETFEDWINVNFGKGIACHFMITYNTKLYRRHPREMTPDCVGRFVPNTDLKKLIKGALSNSNSDLGYNAVFSYPKKGGTETIIKAIVQDISDIYLKERVEKIILKSNQVITNNGKSYYYDVLISTQPVTNLIKMIDEKPNEVNEAATNLKYVSVLNINIGVKGEIGNKHWIYIPEDHLVFYRMGFPSNFSQHVAPVGCSSIYTDISYRPEEGIDPQWAKNRVINDLIKMKIIRDKKDVLVEKIIDIPYAYVIFDKYRITSLQIIEKFLEKNSIYSVGRYGSWKYTSMEDSFTDGMNIANKIIQKYFK